MLPHFAAMGHVCPPQYNPADFVMFLMQKQSDEQLTQMADAWKQKGLANPRESYNTALALSDKQQQQEDEDENVSASASAK